jgi:hypothetical protein
LIEALQKNDSRRRSAIAIRRCKTHRIDVADTGLNRGGEPIPKLFNRIRIKVAPAQTFADVLVTRSGWIAWDFHYFEQKAGR